MKEEIRIIIEHVVDGKIVESSIALQQVVKQVESIEELGFNHRQQIDIIKDCQDGLLKAQSSFLQEDINTCPRCGTKLKLAGKVQSHFHAVFTDHKVPVKRQKCCNKECGWTSVPSISSLFHTNSHPDLSKLQAEIACNHTYREAEKLMNTYSYYPRKINNHDRIHHTVETIGNYISKHQTAEISNDIPPKAELICQIDGGHLKSTEEEHRSFEALASVIYSPSNVIYSVKTASDAQIEEFSRGKIMSKHCAASALDDNLSTIKRQTLIAAQKQGMTADTKITALCDGAKNCWNIVNSLEGECLSIVRILDWFHIAKRFENISLPKYLTKKLDKTKWCLWHGKTIEGIGRFDEIINNTRSEKMKNRIKKLQTYLNNNEDYLVNYAERHKLGKVISSSLAESNVENLINKRCKGKQHMRWLREGVHPLLQVRASCASNDWKCFGSEYVLKAMTQKAA
ncbi:MAG: ISKra4 family transposase [Legionellales bacterium]|nr:MAG: ISKra4 family transposase [Legionellales bacterium]